MIQYDYTDGTVLATLAVLEEPAELPNVRQAKEGGMNPSNAFEEATVIESNAPHQGRAPGVKELARRMGTVIAGQLFAFAGLYVLSLVGMGSFSPMGYLRDYFPAFVTTALFLKAGDDGVLVQSRSNAITQQRKSARRYLRDLYGRWCLYRGFDGFLALIVLSAVVLLLTTPLVPWRSLSFPAYVLARSCLALPLANVELACLHAAISKPNGKATWDRIPNWRAWITVVPSACLDIFLPATGYHLTLQLRELLRRSFPGAVGLRTCPGDGSPGESALGMALVAAPSMASFCIAVVTRAIHTRVAAALLSDDDECLVPFDRKLGAQEKCSHIRPLVAVMNACRSITSESFFRYLRIVTRVAFYEMSCFGLFMVVLFIQLGYTEPCIVIDYTAAFATDIVGCPISRCA